jgi:asparagine synthase (glutamine-hydrolysing)
MAHSLESRAPFLDPALVEFAATLPPRWKLRGKRSKYLLKRARAGRLPAGHLEQPKEGFGAPLSHWLLGPMGEVAAAATRSPALAEWVRPEAVDRLWREHRERRSDNGYKLFGLACLALWLEQTT